MFRNNFGQQDPNQPMVKVELTPIPWTIYRDTDTEPQPVTSKLPSSALVYLDTEDLPPGADRTNFVLANNIIYFGNVGRLSFVGAGIANWYIPNVNPRNNTFTFWSSASSSFHTVVLTPGWYDDPAVLMAAIVSALNTVSIASGLTFAQAARTNYPREFNLVVAGGQYYFLNTCTAITHGDTVYNLPADQTPSVSKIVGGMELKYTLFVDICSTTLTKYARLRSVTSNSKSSIFARAFFGGLDWGNTTYAVTSAEEFSFAFRPAEVVTSIDIQLYDSHGDLLYIPPEMEDKLIFQMTVHVEL